MIDILGIFDIVKDLNEMFVKFENFFCENFIFFFNFDYLVLNVVLLVIRIGRLIVEEEESV